MTDIGGRDLTNRQLGQYRLEAPLGDGAFGRVYRARHVVLDILRAVKVMQADIAFDPQFRERFLREARTAAQLHHPNIVAVFDFGSEGEIQYLVMEYVESMTLAERLPQMPVPGRLREPAVRGWVRDVAAGLDHAHAAGIVHRDLKPANVLIRTSDGRALLSDFGIAQARSDVKLTLTGQAVGTYAYMSPEQCEGVTELTSACDIYALAAMLYEIATGEPPFGRGISAVSGHMEKPMPALKLKAPDLPLELDRVLSRGLAKAPEDRWKTATELAETALAAVPERPQWPRPSAPLRRAETEQTVLEAPPVRTPPPMVLEPEPYAPQPRRLPCSLPLLAAAGAVLLGFGLVASIIRVVETQSNPTPSPTPTTSSLAARLPQPILASVGEAVPVASSQVTVISVDPISAPPPALQVGPGDRLVIVRVQYRTDSGSVPVSPYDWTIIDAVGTVYTPLVDGLGNPLPEEDLGPTRTASGQIGFVVPRTATGLVLNYAAELDDEIVQVTTRG